MRREERRRNKDVYLNTYYGTLKKVSDRRGRLISLGQVLMRLRRRQFTCRRFHGHNTGSSSRGNCKVHIR